MIAVTGSTGWVGGAVCAWLERNGHIVKRLARIGTDSRFDLRDGAWEHEWPKVLEGCTAIVHCAAHVHRPMESLSERALFEEINERGTARLVRACTVAEVRRFVLASTIAVYDWTRPGPPRNEAAPIGPSTAYARSKFAAEQAVQASNLHWFVGRLATVYGNGDRANFYRLAAKLKRRRFFIPGRGSAKKSALPVEKAGELLARLSLLPLARNLVVNLAAPIAPSLTEICQAFKTTCRFPAPRHMPLELMRALAMVGDGLDFLGGTSPLTRSVLQKLSSDTIVNVARMQLLFPDLAWESFENSLRISANYYGNLD